MRTKRHLVTVGIFVLACALYVIGFSNSALAVIALGALLEAVFWVRVIRSSFKSKG